MKRFVILLSFLLSFVFAAAPLAAAESAAQEPKKTETGVLNVSKISEAQAELCTAVMLDGFEGGETERAVTEGTVSSVSVSALEGEKCIRLTGNNSAELTLTLTKRRSTANTRSLCVCAYVEPVGGAEFEISVTVRGTEKNVTGKAELPAGEWYAAYLPVDTAQTVNIESVTVRIGASGGSNVRVSCLVDRVHTALVDGLPDRLRYFASDFTANRGELEYRDDALVFRPSGSNSYIESGTCGYMTNGLYNALAVEIDNNCDGESLILRLKLDDRYSYTEENSHSLKLMPGEHVYSFPIGGFRSGVSVGAFRLELPGAVSGEISIKSIGFASYRFPAEYSGTVTAVQKKDGITVYGTLPDYPASTKRICLYRLTPGFNEEAPGAIDTEPYAEAPASSSFSFDLPLAENGHDNAYFKYLVRYETKTGYEDAGFAYVNGAVSVTPSVAFKGAGAPEDASLLSYLLPGTVYTDVFLDELFSEDGETEFKFADKTARISASALEKCDALTERCAVDKTRVVLRLVYTPSSYIEKYCFASETQSLPDITTEDGAAHYMSLLSFFAERYKNRLAAVIPCGALNADGISEMRGMTADEAEKYAADLIFAAQSVLSPYGIAVIPQIGEDGAELFSGMLEKDVKEPEKLPVYVELGAADEARSVLDAISGHRFPVILSCRTDSAAELARLYYGGKGALGVCARGFSGTDSRAELFSVIDTSYGAAAADRLTSDEFPDGAASVYPDMEKPSKLYFDAGELEPAALPQKITALYDGGTVDGWQSYDSCKSIYTGEVNGESAAGLAFDFGSGCFGYASFSPEQRKNHGTVYFRLYADYLPEDVSGIRLRICAEGDRGTAAGYCTLEAETAFVISFDTGSVGRVKRFTFAPLDVRSASTPRICVSGIYTSGGDSSETLTEAQTETMPEPESQRFDTADTSKTGPDAKTDRARLYIIAISVILGMFVLCGGVIAVLKIKDRNK